jgi:hypothetical protein
MTSASEISELPVRKLFVYPSLLRSVRAGWMQTFAAGKQ